MRICCIPFLCFGEVEEDNNTCSQYYFKGKYSMEEGDLGREIDEFRNDDLKLGNDAGVEGEESGLLANDGNAESEPRFEFVDEKIVELMGWNMDSRFATSDLSVVNVNVGLVGGPSSASSSRVAQERDSYEQDSQNKRAKVQSLNLGSGPNNEKGIHYVAPVHEVIYEDMPDSGDAGEDASNSNDGNLVLGDLLEVQIDLTDDLLHMVLSFLDHIDLCRAASVCKQWRDASSHEDFWRYLNFENRPISEEQFEDMCRRYPNATAVNVCGTRAIHSFGIYSINVFRNIEALTLGKGQLGETFFQALTDCHTLRSLTINDATLDAGTQEILIHHNGLHNLQIMKCRMLRVSIRCPQLETLSLKRSSMPNVVLNCPLLRMLDIASCHKLVDAAIRTAATSCPLLESLDLSNCSCASDETLQEIALSCGNLHVLDASYCPNISLESVTLSMLTVLKLHSCEGITSASMAAVARCPMLEVLELDNCSLLTSVSLDLLCLQSISLVHCRKFVDLNLRSNALSAITVSNCPSLQTINIASNALKKLVLQKQDSLTTLALQCYCLQEVDLTECESLTNSVCEVFSSGGCCSALRSLVLDSCESLTAVSLSSTSLVSLSLGGCRAVTSLDLSCPYLEHISLVGCDHLERATFSPVGLRSLNLGICPKLSVLHVEAPELVSLELKGCGVLSEAFIGCPLLTSLDASFCGQLKDEYLSATASSCPLIITLVLMSCPSVGPDGLSSLHCLQNLTFLDLSYTFLVNLQPVFDSCVYLKVLKLQACKYLSESSLEPLYKHNALPALCELDLSYGTLRQSALEELLACCRRLTHVSLNGCVNMHDLDWSFQVEKFNSTSTVNDSSVESILHSEVHGDRLLQSLNCVGCPNIKKVVIPPTARCFHLTLLNLSLSSNLKEVDLSCCDLIILNLSNCNFLEILKLDCPRLTSLFLQSCSINEEAVEAAIKQCGMLETLDVRFCPKIYTSSMGILRAACSSLKRIFSSLPCS